MPRTVNNKLCVVCGDQASGYNFNALTCESCKAFFRRNAHKEFTKCRYQGSCVMNIDRRRLCSFCRLNKCNEMGMRKDWIWNEQAKKTRKLKIEFNKIKRDLEHCCTGTEIAVVTSTTPDPSTNTICTVSPAPFYNVCDVVDYILYCEQNLTNIFANIYVRAVELELTVIPIATPGTKTGDNFNQLELCRLNELFSVTKPAATTMINSVRLPWPIVTPQTMADKHQAMDYTLESEIKYVVKLFKKLVKFSEVNDLDRIKLIKHSSIQIHCLRAVTNYNVDDECFYLKMDNDNMIAKIQLDSMRHSTSTHSRFREFLKKLKYEIDHDANIIDLLTAIVLFNPDHPDLENAEPIKMEQKIYMYLLKRYLNLKYRSECTANVKFLNLLNTLNELFFVEHRILFGFSKRDTHTIPQLIREVTHLKISGLFPLCST